MVKQENWRTGDAEIGSGSPVGACRREHLKIFTHGAPQGQAGSNKAGRKVPTASKPADVGSPPRKLEGARHESIVKGRKSRVPRRRCIAWEGVGRARVWASYSFTAFGYEPGKCRDCVSMRRNSGNTTSLFRCKRGVLLARREQVKRGTFEQKMSHDVIRLRARRGTSPGFLLRISHGSRVPTTVSSSGETAGSRGDLVGFEAAAVAEGHGLGVFGAQNGPERRWFD